MTDPSAPPAETRRVPLASGGECPDCRRGVLRVRTSKPVGPDRWVRLECRHGGDPGCGFRASRFAPGRGRRRGNWL